MALRAAVFLQFAVRLTLSDKQLTETRLHTPEERGGRVTDNSPECVFVSLQTNVSWGDSVLTLPDLLSKFHTVKHHLLIFTLAEIGTPRSVPFHGLIVTQTRMTGRT